MFQSVPAAAFQQIPFLDITAWSQDRYVSNLSFYVKGQWHLYMWDEKDKFIELRGTPVEADYFGDAPERPSDQCFPLFNLIAQLASFKEMHMFAAGIWEDFQNLATSLAKIDLFFETSKTKGKKTTRFVATEIEYIIGVCRSIFDLMQEMVSRHWERIILHDKSITKRQLPKSFADVLFSSNTLQTEEQIAQKYGLPSTFADWYLTNAKFFSWIRDVRNRMIHSGSQSVEMLFTTERGYAIKKDERFWTDVYTWPEDAELHNNLYPIRPAICSIVWLIINSTTTLAQMLETTFKGPKPMFPGLKYFSRGFYDNVFVELEDVLTHSWWDDTHREMVRPTTPATST
jgi:hypothetical protein